MPQHAGLLCPGFKTSLAIAKHLRAIHSLTCATTLNLSNATPQSSSESAQSSAQAANPFHEVLFAFALAVDTCHVDGKGTFAMSSVSAAPGVLFGRDQSFVETIKHLMCANLVHDKLPVQWLNAKGFVSGDAKRTTAQDARAIRQVKPFKHLLDAELLNATDYEPWTANSHHVEKGGVGEKHVVAIEQRLEQILELLRCGNGDSNRAKDFLFLFETARAASSLPALARDTFARTPPAPFQTRLSQEVLSKQWSWGPECAVSTSILWQCFHNAEAAATVRRLPSSLGHCELGSHAQLLLDFNLRACESGIPLEGAKSTRIRCCATYFQLHSLPTLSSIARCTSEGDGLPSQNCPQGDYTVD